MMLDEYQGTGALRFEAKAITLEGRMTTKGLRTLTDLIPIPAETLDLQETGAESRRDRSRVRQLRLDRRTLKVTTSKKYFQHISLLLDALRTELKDPMMSPKIGAEAAQQGGAGGRSPAGAQCRRGAHRLWHRSERDLAQHA